MLEICAGTPLKRNAHLQESKKGSQQSHIFLQVPASEVDAGKFIQYSTSLKSC